MDKVWIILCSMRSVSTAISEPVLYFSSDSRYLQCVQYRYIVRMRQIAGAPREKTEKHGTMNKIGEQKLL